MKYPGRQIGIAAGIVCLAAVFAYKLFSFPGDLAPESIPPMPDAVATDTEKSINPNEDGPSDEKKQELDPTSAANSDDSTPIDPNNTLATAERAKFVNSPELPGGIALRHLDMKLRRYEGDEEYSEIDWLQDQIDVSAEEAATISAAVMAARERSKDEITRTAYEMFCAGEVPKFYGDDVYPVLQQFEDLEETIPGDHLQAAYEELDAPLAKKLESLIDEVKLDITYIKYDQKAAFELMPITGDQVLARNCIAFHAKLSN